MTKIITADERAVIDAAKAWHTSRKGCDLGMVSSTLYNAVDAMLANKGKPSPQPVTVEECAAAITRLRDAETLLGPWITKERRSEEAQHVGQRLARRAIDSLLVRLTPALEPCARCGSTCKVVEGASPYVRCEGEHALEVKKCFYSGPCWNNTADAVKYHNVAQVAIRKEKEAEDGK